MSNEDDDRMPFWAVDASGELRDADGRVGDRADKEAFVALIDAKIDAGTASMTERRCRAAVVASLADADATSG